jgi:ABC-type polysaccharide/polyol phosphate transport system ATPase subunit
MLPEGSVEAHGLWKRFRADRQRMLLRDNVERMARRLRGSDLADWRWVLKDIDLSIAPGDAVGLIGSNGSGKSTLLKILTRVMFPYAGTLDVRGRVGALIEVRAGIHPDLTGRENVYLFGSLLGLSRREVATRFDAIVDFAELETAIDRQVKYYSSGMQMRLGFAVAAFLEPHVLLVDEVLAVGDALFQQKCLDRMREVLQLGTTLVLVSHDLASVSAVCSRGVWLDRGAVQVDGTIREAITAYRDSIEEEAEARVERDEPVRLLKAEVTGAEQLGVATQQPMAVKLVCPSDYVGSGVLHLGVSEGTASPVFTVRREVQLAAEDLSFGCTISRVPLPRGRYVLWAGLYDHDGQPLMAWHPATQFDVLGPDLDPPPRAVVLAAPVHVEAHWH